MIDEKDTGFKRTLKLSLLAAYVLVVFVAIVVMMCVFLTLSFYATILVIYYVPYGGLVLPVGLLALWWYRKYFQTTSFGMELDDTASDPDPEETSHSDGLIIDPTEPTVKVRGDCPSSRSDRAN
jgi:hypothetical protein